MVSGPSAAGRWSARLTAARSLPSCAGTGQPGAGPATGVTQGETFTSGRPGKDRNGVLGGRGQLTHPGGGVCPGVLQVAERPRFVGCGPAAWHVELAIDRDRVLLHGRWGHQEFPGDLLVRHPAVEQDQDLGLAIGEHVVPTGGEARSGDAVTRQPGEVRVPLLRGRREDARHVVESAAGHVESTQESREVGSGIGDEANRLPGLGDVDGSHERGARGVVAPAGLVDPREEREELRQPRAVVHSSGKCEAAREHVLGERERVVALGGQQGAHERGRGGVPVPLLARRSDIGACSPARGRRRQAPREGDLSAEGVREQDKSPDWRSVV